jgi:hypothetical protein
MKMPSPLENLSGPGKALSAELPDAKEFASLQRSGLARLGDAHIDSLSLEGRLNQKGHPFGWPFWFLVEVAGIEPASESVPSSALHA